MARHVTLVALAAATATAVQLSLSALAVHALRPLVLFHAAGFGWQVRQLLFVVMLLCAPLLLGRDLLLACGIVVLASGAASNAFSVTIWPGVVDFFPAAGLAFSTGDLGIIAGSLLGLAGAVRALRRFPEIPPAVALICRFVYRG